MGPFETDNIAQQVASVPQTQQPQSRMTGGSGLLGTVLNMVYDTGMYFLQRHNNKKDATTDFNRQVKLWNMTNEYNSPVEQIKRLKQAGLNPDLMYGNGSASAGNTSTPASSMSQPAQMQSFNIASAYAQLRSQRLQNKALELQNRGVDLDNQEKEKNLGLRAKESEHMMSYQDALLKLQSNEYSLKREQFDWQKSNDDRDFKLREDEFNKNVELIDQQIQNLIKQGELTDAQAAVARKQVSLIVAQISELQQRRFIDWNRYINDEAKFSEELRILKANGDITETQASQIKDAYTRIVETTTYLKSRMSEEDYKKLSIIDIYGEALQRTGKGLVITPNGKLHVNFPLYIKQGWENPNKNSNSIDSFVKAFQLMIALAPK